MQRVTLIEGADTSTKVLSVIDDLKKGFKSILLVTPHPIQDRQYLEELKEVKTTDIKSMYLHREKVDALLLVSITACLRELYNHLTSWSVSLSLQLLECQIRGGECIVGMDDRIGPEVVPWLRILRKEEIKIYKDPPLPSLSEKRSLNRGHLLQLLEEKLRDGRRIFISIAAEIYARSVLYPLIVKYVDPSRFRFYSKKNEFKAELREIAQVWSKLQVIMCTPKLHLSLHSGEMKAFDYYFTFLSTPSSQSREERGYITFLSKKVAFPPVTMESLHEDLKKNAVDSIWKYFNGDILLMNGRFEVYFRERERLQCYLISQLEMKRPLEYKIEKRSSTGEKRSSTEGSTEEKRNWRKWERKQLMTVITQIKQAPPLVTPLLLQVISFDVKEAMTKIQSKYRPEITSDMLAAGVTYREQAYNIRLYLDFSPEAIIDQDRSDGKESLPTYQRYSVVERICKMLKIPHPFDRRMEVSSERIKDNLSFLRKIRSEIEDSLYLRQEDQGYRFINEIFSNWYGCHLELIRKEKKVRYYCLREVELGFDDYVKRMIPLEEPDF